MSHLVEPGWSLDDEPRPAPDLDDLDDILCTCCGHQGMEHWPDDGPGGVVIHYIICPECEYTEMWSVDGGAS